MRGFLYSENGTKLVRFAFSPLLFLSSEMELANWQVQKKEGAFGNGKMHWACFQPPPHLTNWTGIPQFTPVQILHRKMGHSKTYNWLHNGWALLKNKKNKKKGVGPTRICMEVFFFLFLGYTDDLDGATANTTMRIICPGALFVASKWAPPGFGWRVSCPFLGKRIWMEKLSKEMVPSVTRRSNGNKSSVVVLDLWQVNELGWF